MDVVLGIGMKMMMAVLGRPPENALLGGGLGQEREQELERAARGVSPMRKVAVVTRADGEHPQPVESDGDRRRLPGHAGPNCGKAREVKEDEGDSGRIEDIVVGLRQFRVQDISPFQGSLA